MEGQPRPGQFLLRRPCGYRRHVQVVLHRCPSTSFLPPHAAKLKTFSYIGLLRISSPFLILRRAQRFSILALSAPSKGAAEEIRVSPRGRN